MWNFAISFVMASQSNLQQLQISEEVLIAKDLIITRSTNYNVICIMGILKHRGKQVKLWCKIHTSFDPNNLILKKSDSFCSAIYVEITATSWLVCFPKSTAEQTTCLWVIMPRGSGNSERLQGNEENSFETCYQVGDESAFEATVWPPTKPQERMERV